MRGQTTFLVPEPAKGYEDNHMKKHETARTQLINRLFGALDAAREVDVNCGMRVGESVAEWFPGATIKRPMKYGSRRVEIPRTQFDRACMAALVMKLFTFIPQTPSEYEKIIEDNLWNDRVACPHD